MNTNIPEFLYKEDAVVIEMVPNKVLVMLEDRFGVRYLGTGTTVEEAAYDASSRRQINYDQIT